MESQVSNSELIGKTEMEIQAQKANYGHLVGKSKRDTLGDWDWHVYTAIDKMQK